MWKPQRGALRDGEDAGGGKDDAVQRPGLAGRDEGRTIAVGNLDAVSAADVAKIVLHMERTVGLSGRPHEERAAAGAAETAAEGAGGGDVGDGEAERLRLRETDGDAAARGRGRVRREILRRRGVNRAGACDGGRLEIDGAGGAALDGIPPTLTALMRAQKLFKKANKAKLLDPEEIPSADAMTQEQITDELCRIARIAQLNGWDADSLLRNETRRLEDDYRRREASGRK